MRDVTKLLVWRRAVDLSAAVAAAIPIRAARKSPGIRRQAIRAACQIAEAIAEGAGKRTERDFARFLDMATGSTTELQTQLVLARQHGILDGVRFKTLWKEAGEIRRMLVVFQRNVRERADAEERDNSRSQHPRRHEVGDSVNSPDP